MPQTYYDFRTAYLGRAVDIDHAYGAQCWDGAMEYSRWLGYPVFHCGLTEYAQDIWLLRKTSGILNYYDEIEWLEPGDIVVFQKVPGVTPLSHIAIFDHDIDGVNGAFLGQNQDVNDPSFTILSLPYSATYQTAFRPKCFAAKPKPDPKPERIENHIYRLYNPYSGDHLYTMNYDEVVNCNKAGWKVEKGWKCPNGGIPVYRLYNGKIHTYGFKAEADELVKSGWKNEGTAFNSSGHNMVYRLYNPVDGSHVLTVDREEHNVLSNIGWICEGADFKY